MPDTPIATINASIGDEITIPGVGVVKITKTESKVKAWLAKVYAAIKSSPMIFLYGAAAGGILGAIFF